MKNPKKKNRKPKVDLDTALSNELIKMEGLRSEIAKSGDTDLLGKADASRRQLGDLYLSEMPSGYARVKAEREAAGRLAA
jgi:hypothetical protein